MRYIITICIVLISCAKRSDSGFIVRDINSGEFGCNEYIVEYWAQGKGNGLRFRDSVGKFQVGDTIIFTKK